MPSSPKTRSKKRQTKTAARSAVKAMKREGLSEQEMTFVYALIANGYNGTAAALEAGYAESSAKVMACRLQQRPSVRRAINEVMLAHIKTTGVRVEECILQMYYILTRRADDFCDENGELINDVSALNERAQACVDGIEQEVTERTYDDGSVERKVKTKLKVTSKTEAIKLAMQHKGLLDPDLVANITQNNINIDWSKLREDRRHEKPQITLEIEKLEQSLPDDEQKR